ncbi:Nudix hydrolase 15, mitochondrial-like protein [Drosera capensis]
MLFLRSSILRIKTPFKMPSKPFTIPQSKTPLMDSSSSNSTPPCSQRLLALAHQLRLYNPPPEEDDEIEFRANKVITQVGFPESVSPVEGNENVRKDQGLESKRAAVLVCLFEGDDGDLRVILTKRSSKLSTHSGCYRRTLLKKEGNGDVVSVWPAPWEVALPGGKKEEGDKDDAETATREANEEIGLDPSLVNVVTVLEPYLSKHLLKVVPVIGILSNKDAFTPVPNAEEVDAVFDAPLDVFIKDENRRVEEREWMGYKYLVHYFDYETSGTKYLIWGLTAGILIRAASVVFDRSPPFLEQNPRMKVPRTVTKDTVLP